MRWLKVGRLESGLHQKLIISSIAGLGLCAVKFSKVDGVGPVSETYLAYKNRLRLQATGTYTTPEYAPVCTVYTGAYSGWG